MGESCQTSFVILIGRSIVFFVYFLEFLFSFTHRLQAIQIEKRLCTHASGGSFLLVLYTTNSKGRSQEVRLEAFTLDRDSVGKGTIYAV